MTTHTIYTSDNAEVIVPEGEGIFLHITGSSPEEESVELTELSALLLSNGSVSPAVNETVSDRSVEFGTLECGDNVSFRLSGSPVSQEDALAILGEGVIAAIKAAVAVQR